MIYDTLEKIWPVEKGWSEDKKYGGLGPDGRKYFLRVSPAHREARARAAFDITKRLEALDVPLPAPIEQGVAPQGDPILEGRFYTITAWVQGEDGESVLPLLSETSQYQLGLEAGRILRTIHTLPAPADQPDWEARFWNKTYKKIQRYRACGVRFPGDEKVIAYLEENKSLLANRPQCFQHGDYHVGNMLIEEGALKIIDFDRFDFGDPWEEFNRIPWCAQCSPLFASAMLRGYFGGEPPLIFWKLLLFYIASNTLSSIYWAIDFGEQEMDTMQRQAREVLEWYQELETPIPSWYLPEPYFQWADGVPYQLKAPFDFSFLQDFGRVFQVFDTQDSGNICFGVEKEKEWFFLKFAGAPTALGSVTPAQAVENLKATVPIYRDLAHPALAKLLSAQEVGGGFALVFPWSQGMCMGIMYPLSHQKFQKLSLASKCSLFQQLLEFHRFVAEQGYVAIDFYDGSVLYEEAEDRLTIVDIDFYAKPSPGELFVNTMGRMWGSSRFMSPEEWALGAVIDEVTNVYTMGATAFALFSQGDRKEEAWPLRPAQFQVIQKAVSPQREERQQSIATLIKEWREAT